MPGKNSFNLKEIAELWITEGWQKNNLQIIDKLHSPDFIDHDPSGRTPDNEGFKNGLTSLYKSFPDFHAEIEDLVINESSGKAAIRWKAEGTHSEEYLGFSPTYNKIRFKGIEIIIIRDNRITERWGEWDGIHLLDQLKK